MNGSNIAPFSRSRRFIAIDGFSLAVRYRRCSRNLLFSQSQQSCKSPRVSKGETTNTCNE
jgi:hypothetical protein